MPVTQAKPIIHGDAQDDRIEVWVYTDHLQIILHRASLKDGIVNKENTSGNKFLWEELFKVVHLPLFVGIHEHKIERSFKFIHLHVGITPDAGNTI
jgi:hypothetical protein